MRQTLLCLAFTLIAGPADAQRAPQVSRTELDAHALRALSGAPIGRGDYLLGPGAVCTLYLEGPLAARSVGLWWSGELGAASIALEEGELGFGPLLPCLEDPHLALESAHVERPAGTRRVSGLHHAYDAPARALLLELRGPLRLSSLDLIWIGPGQEPRRSPPNTPQSAGAYPKPGVWSRASWGAVPPQCSFGTCTTTHVGIHHTASASGGLASSWSDCAGNVLSIQAYHMYSNGWCDVGYNYLACPTGDLFEGRAGGDGVVGAHDGHNCGSMGVCLMGYYHPPVNQQPPTLALDAIEELIAWKSSQQGIDPYGSSWYAGYSGVMANLYGHKDVKNTACPGDQLYPQLGAMKDDIAALIAGGGPSAGTLKGVLYDESIGTHARIAGGSVALADGSFTQSTADGYYEFDLPPGAYALGATAPGFAANSSIETVSQGDVWESLGLSPSSLPLQAVAPIGGNAFLARFQGDVGSPVFFALSAQPGLPVVAFGGAGLAWPDLGALQVLVLGNIPSSGTLVIELQAPALHGLNFHSQAYVLHQGVARLSNGAAFGTD